MNSLLKKHLFKQSKMDIIEDWSLSIKLSDGEKKMTGLKKINVEKLKSLSKNKLHDLNTNWWFRYMFC